jgi:hypothetical protein
MHSQIVIRSATILTAFFCFCFLFFCDNQTSNPATQATPTTPTIPTTMSSILAQTVQQAVAFLTAPLLDTTYPIHSIDILQRSLTSSLTTRYTVAGHWDSHPEIGFESRAIRLSPAAPPPTFIARACEAAAISWADWLYLLNGGKGLDLDIFVDPGVVSVQFRKYGCPPTDMFPVWQFQKVHNLIHPSQSGSLTTLEQPSTQELLAFDNDDEIFDLINQKIHSPSWVSTWTQKGEHPAACKAPSYMPSTLMVPKLAPVPASARGGFHSRSSSSSSFTSRSSNSSGSPQYSTYSLSSDESEGALNWRQKAPKPDCNNRRPTPPQVDASKASVTAYDGGKTLVASGGVTLGSMGRARRV